MKSQLDRKIQSYTELTAKYDVLNNKISSLQKELHNLTKKNKDEREANDYLRLLIEDNDCKVIQLFEENSKQYSKETQQCVYDLLAHNVTTSKVSPVISIVLQLVRLSANTLPCLTTINSMNVQRLLLCQM